MGVDAVADHLRDVPNPAAALRESERVQRPELLAAKSERVDA
jgi:hypothetical protein